MTLGNKVSDNPISQVLVQRYHPESTLVEPPH